MILLQTFKALPLMKIQNKLKTMHLVTLISTPSQNHRPIHQILKSNKNPHLQVQTIFWISVFLKLQNLKEFQSMTFKQMHSKPRARMDLTIFYKVLNKMNQIFWRTRVSFQRMHTSIETIIQIYKETSKLLTNISGRALHLRCNSLKTRQ